MEGENEHPGQGLIEGGATSLRFHFCKESSRNCPSRSNRLHGSSFPISRPPTSFLKLPPCAEPAGPSSVGGHILQPPPNPGFALLCSGDALLVCDPSLGPSSLTDGAHPPLAGAPIHPPRLFPPQVSWRWAGPCW